MSPLFMDTGYDPNSPGSLSAEDCNSNTAGSEREGDGPQTGPRGKKRREKNRDAARKSRKKQTERADELHEELQRIERSNSALLKTITDLKKEAKEYTNILERHEPYCLLRASPETTSTSTSTSPTCLSKGGSSSPRVPPQASSAILSTPLPTSLSSGMGRQALDCVDRTRRSPSASASASVGLIDELFPSSSSSSSPSSTTSPVTAPYSLSFSTHTAPHSLFCDDPPANVSPVSAGLLPSRVPFAHSGHEASAAPVQPFTTDSFLTKQAPFLTASPPTNTLPRRSPLETESLRVQDASVSLPQLHPYQFSRHLNTLPYCTPPLSAHFPLQPNSTSLLSLLTVPSPPNISQATSRSFPQPPPPPIFAESTKDLSLSELLEINDWILSSNSTE
ncbi:putative protein TPRXL [Mugil cephalus]|uniref:putative protein TPRXL n=1 Tax=Mugil cephalus TaxID=48193 RepID=UPI001FB7CE9D|nr:putative protein TPRXL [Mugil cephalus]